MNDKPIFGAFDTGKTPVISMVNQATTPLGVNFSLLCTTLQQFVDGVFAPVWHTPAYIKKTPVPIPGTYVIVFLDDADQANALGYHDLTPEGFPISKVFVRTTIQDGQKVSVTAAHELVEMLVDPAVNLLAMDAQGNIYAYEVADAVEETTFFMNGVPITNFIYPSWFEGFRQPNSTKFDYLGKVKAPFQLLPGGYAITFKNGQWEQVFGSESKAARFAKEDRRQHRSEYRKCLVC